MIASSGWQTIDSIAGRALLGAGLIVLAVSVKRVRTARGTNL